MNSMHLLCYSFQTQAVDTVVHTFHCGVSGLSEVASPFMCLVNAVDCRPWHTAYSYGIKSSLE